MHTIEQLLSNFPRLKLANLPTPLHFASRLGSELNIPNLLIKRDDLTGLALGGNKARKLEFILADAISKGADSIVISAAAQSNMIRMTAAACAQLGLDIYAVMRSTTETPPIEGNLLLDALFGANITFIPTLDPYSDMSVKVMENIVKSLKAQGKKPYVIDLRYHSASLAALGYISAVDELDRQFAALDRYPEYIFLCTGSGTTQAGLLLGIMLKNLPIKVIGISVQKPADWIRPRIMEKLQATTELLHTDLRLSEDDVIVDDRWIGERYGVPTAEGLNAIKLVGRMEGIILDPVYSGKGFSGLVGWINEGSIKPESSIVFLHSGGAPALFASEQKLNITIKKLPEEISRQL